MAHPVVVVDDSFQAEVISASKPVLVDFWAEWCQPCKMIAPILETLAEEYSDNLKIAKFDIDNNVNVQMQYGVYSLPTLILFKEGKEVDRFIGFMPKERLTNKIKPHLNTVATS
jgi:thioredoxin 1